MSRIRTQSKAPGVKKRYCLDISWRFYTVATTEDEALRGFNNMLRKSRIPRDHRNHLVFTGYIQRDGQSVESYPPPPLNYTVRPIYLWWSTCTSESSFRIMVALPPNSKEPRGSGQRQVGPHRYSNGYDLTSFPSGTLIQAGDCWRELEATDLEVDLSKSKS